ncbi:MAG: NADH-quinone oxidoreductase subunit M [Bacteroidota bacterium]|jgi:NADH-quinone oxidoreductase subunit M|nr:NADH-quinone oxidoreductase subunit M [Bacteroidota bacterium]
MQFPILTLITFLPVLGMIIVLLLPKDNKRAIQTTTVIVTGLQVVLAMLIWAAFDTTKTGINDVATMQFVERLPWIVIPETPWFGEIRIEYFMGIDGLSMPMVLLTALISFLATFSSFSITKSFKGYFAMFLLLDTGMMGVFVSLDMFLFYVFWEVMLLPMYFLIGIWGGPRREYAAIKFFLYTLAGSVLLLLVMIGLYFSTTDPDTGLHTFSIIAMMDPANVSSGVFATIGSTARMLAFVGLFIGFAIKVPIFPFHTWLPDAHVEAPTAISVILAGVLLKMGTYGLLRISFPIFPEMTHYFQIPMMILGFVNIVYGALCAMAQTDFKKLIAYSSVSHMGYVLLGMAALNVQGMTGAVFQMFNHGTITAMLFLLVGVLYDRAHTRGLNEFGGVYNKMPVYSFLTVIAFFAAIGLPSMSGFISEAFVFLGAFQANRLWTILSTLGIVLGAGYMLWTFQRVFMGTLPEKWDDVLTDVNGRELFTLVPLAIIIIALGIYPSPALNWMSTSLGHLVDFVNANAAPVLFGGF